MRAQNDLRRAASLGVLGVGAGGLRLAPVVRLNAHDRRNLTHQQDFDTSLQLPFGIPHSIIHSLIIWTHYLRYTLLC